MSPMNDITALSQSLKNSASKAMIEEGLAWFSEEQLSHENGIALHKADAEFIALANPANVLALVEALEKSQQRIAELESKLAKPVLLPKTNGYWTEQEKAYEEAITLAKRQVRLAGFCVEDM